MSKSKIVSVILILGTLFVGCSLEKGQPVPTPSSAPPTPISPSAAEQVTITFACPSGARTAYEKLAENFHRPNPDVQVQVIAIEDILGTDGKSPDSTYRVTSAADTALTFITWADTRQGLLRDLQPFIEADFDFQPEDFYPSTLEVFRWDGGAWALPRAVDPLLIFYDKDAFDLAGVVYPQPDWSWEEFVETASALTDHQEDQVVRYGFVDPWVTGALGLVPGLAGQPLIDDSVQPSIPVLDRPEVAAAARRYVDLSLADGVMFTGYEVGDPQQVFELIEGKRAAMWTEEASWGWRRAESFRLGVAPLPKGEVSNNLLWEQGLVMSAGTAHPEESWRWLAFLTRQPLVEGEVMPARRSVAEKMGYWEALDDEVRVVYRYVLEHALTWWPYDEIVEAFSGAIRTALGGEEGVEEALAEAQGQAYEEMAARLEGAPMPVVVPTPEPEQPQGAEVVVTFAGFLSRPGESRFYQDLAESFAASHPDIAVEVTDPGDEAHTLSDMAALADCFRWRPFARISSVLSLDPLIEADADFDVTDFYQQALEECRIEGKLWGLPSSISPQILYYNEDLFDEAGVEYPQLGWTWDDFLAKAIQLTSGEGGAKQYGFVDARTSTDTGAPPGILYPFVYSRINPLQESPLALDDPEVIEAVRWYFDLAREHGIMPLFAREQEMASRSSLILNGRAAMWVDRVETFVRYRADLEQRYRVGAVPLPAGRTGAVAFTHRAYFISEGTAHPDVCWEWIKYLTDHSLIEWGVPARRSVAESPQFQDKVGTEKARAYLASLDYEAVTPASLFGISPDEIHAWYSRWEAFYEALWEIAEGEDVQVALKRAEAQLAESY